MNAITRKATTFFAGSMIAAGLLGAASGIAGAAPDDADIRRPNVSSSTSVSAAKVPNGQNASSGQVNAQQQKPQPPKTPIKLPSLPPAPAKK